MTKWHRIPKAMKPAAVLTAAIGYAFGQPKLYSKTPADDLLPAGIYHFAFFDLLETTGGSWYFKTPADDKNQTNKC